MTPCPGEKLTLKIGDIAFGGEGVSRVGDFVIFVPFVAVGEVIEAQIVEVRKRFARARLLRVLESSPERTGPQCRYFGDCGGCQYQHLSYPAQLALKHKQIGDLFQRIGGVDPAVVLPVVGSPQPYEYRNRIMIRSQWDKYKQGLNIGFIRNDNRLVVDIEECRIAEPALNDQIKHVRNHPPPKGGIKVVLRVQPEGWEVPRDSFFQNNFFLLPELLSTVRERLTRARTRHLVDLYCGVGFFGIELAAQMESFVGLELDERAIEAARRNAAARGVCNGEFIAGSVDQMLPSVVERFSPGLTSVLLDPPRKGCTREVLDLLREVQPAQIVYVSCHPATMARDLNILCGNDVYSLAQVIPLDMFPQTAHVECVADLRTAGAASPARKLGLPSL